MDTTTLKVGTVGEVLVLDVGGPMTGDEECTIDVLRPDLSMTTWTATPIPGEPNITYTLQEGDLDQVGNYYITPIIDGALGDTARIRVIEKFD